MASSRMAQRDSRMPEYECMRGCDPKCVEKPSKYVAGQLLCQSGRALTKGFRTKAFPKIGITGVKGLGDGEKLNTVGKAELRAGHEGQGARARKTKGPSAAMGVRCARTHLRSG